MEVNETLRNPGEVYLNNQKHVQRNDLQRPIRGKTTDKFDVKTGVRRMHTVAISFPGVY